MFAEMYSVALVNLLKPYYPATNDIQRGRLALKRYAVSATTRVQIR